MSLAREVRVTILGDNSQGRQSLNELGDTADRTDGRFSRLGDGMGKFAKVAAVGLAGAVVGIGLGLKGAIEAAEESRKVIAQTEAVLKSTGGVANVTADGVDKLSSSLSAMSGIDDEVISGGQNLLLTFTQVRNEVGKGNDIFNQGTKAALDMSVALGTDMNSASMLVGKALNDPIKGMTALTKSGITFTEQQREQVKAMVAAGDTLGAQKVILKELETQFGGSAAAAASPMERLKVVIGNLQEEVGARLLPVIAAAAGFLADNLPAALDRVGSVLGPIIEKVGIFAGAIKSGFSGEGVTSEGFVGVMERIGLAVRSVVDWVVANWPQIKATIMEVVGTIVAFVQENWPRIQETISNVLETVKAVVSGAVEFIMTIWNNFGSQIMFVIQSAWEFIMSTVNAALEIIQGIVKIVTGIISGDWGKVWEGIKQVLGGAWDFIMARIEFALDLIKAIISVGLEIVKGFFSGAWDRIKEMAGAAWDWLKDTISGGIDGIIEFVSGLPGRILGALGSLGSLLFSAGKDLIRGLMDGIRDMASAAAEAAKEVARKAMSAVKNFLGIGSPSKVFMGFGVNVGEGFVAGMDKSGRAVATAGERMAGASIPGVPGAGAGASFSGSSSAGGITVNVGTLVGTDGMHELMEIIQAELLRKQRRVPSLGFA